MRDARAVARKLLGSLRVSFAVEPGGAQRFSVDDGYPILRGVPVSPPKPIAVGERWQGNATVVVRPRTGSPATRVRVLVEYEYRGSTSYGGIPAQSIRARYAVRYRGNDPAGDPQMVGATGGRTADILVAAEDGRTLFVRELIDETYSYDGGSNVRLKGFILHFHEGSVAGDRARIASALGGLPTHGGSPTVVVASSGEPEQQPGEAGEEARPPEAAAPAATTPSLTGGGTPAFEIAEGERGVTLLLYDLRFVADGDQLVPSERGRLDAIATALGALTGVTFLVEGHTADVGKAAGQYELSDRRAKRIVDELVSRGIPAGRFMYRGLGADQPIAPNDTEANRARNRRVEITILE
ncbi:MAG: OmpA family protein [Spirochaetales bacterium]|nr:OmpA family protein [Spirochaetales bacterium]